jgi:hypothetical protein
MTLFMFFCTLFWNTLCTDCTKAKAVMDDVMGRTMIDMQMGCYLVNGHGPIRQNHVTGTFNIVSSSAHGWAA